MAEEQLTPLENLLSSEEAVVQSLTRFITGVTRLSHTSDWETMSLKLDRGFGSVTAANAPPGIGETVELLRSYLPEIKQILEALFNPSKDVMMKNIETYIKSNS